MPAAPVHGSEAIDLAIASLSDRCPQIASLREDFVAHLARVGSEGDLCLEDLLLAYASAVGHAPAITLLERDFLVPIDRALARKSPTTWSDDAQQRLRAKLLVGDDRRPALLEYSGRGPLRNWLRVTATRVLLTLARGKSPPVEGDALLDEFAAADPDPELAYLKQRHRADVRAAIEEAVSSLDPAERTILRYAIVDRLDAGRIARIYGIHRTSAGRRLAEARELLIKRTRSAIRRRLQVSERELDSILAMVRSRVEITFERLLGERE
jgi:RNA polymerase sigma-70 factor (ECF subfamily)